MTEPVLVMAKALTEVINSTVKLPEMQGFTKLDMLNAIALVMAGMMEEGKRNKNDLAIMMYDIQYFMTRYLDLETEGKE